MQSAGNKGQHHIALVPTEQTRNCSCDSVPVWCMLSPYSMHDAICTSPLPGTLYFSLHPHSAVLTVNYETEPINAPCTPTHTDRTSGVAAAPSHTALGSATWASGKYGDLHNLLWMLTSTHVLNLKTKLKWIRGKTLKDNGFFKSHLQQLLWTLALI